ncbi:hypothetical protein BHE74_00027499 [Ensete ventricosum]|nr:hypothetical protein GW17_00006541 [Ensete ventricosum]RWW65210.1 hypothetical protein BHE74_00027499 [Ensete ventricosum]
MDHKGVTCVTRKGFFQEADKPCAVSDDDSRCFLSPVRRLRQLVAAHGLHVRDLMRSSSYRRPRSVYDPAKIGSIPQPSMTPATRGVAVKPSKQEDDGEDVSEEQDGDKHQPRLHSQENLGLFFLFLLSGSHRVLAVPMVMVKEEMRRGPWTEQEDLQLAWFAALWSRIARRLPGRTDNEIKNYWRTHTRKKAQEQKRSCSPSRTTTSPADDFPIGSEPRAEAAAGCHLSSSCMSLGLDEDSHGADWCSMDQAWNEMGMPEAIDGRSFGDCKASNAWPLSMPSPPVWECCSSAPLWKPDEEEELNSAAFGL